MVIAIENDGCSWMTADELIGYSDVAVVRGHRGGEGFDLADTHVSIKRHTVITVGL